MSIKAALAIVMMPDDLALSFSTLFLVFYKNLSKERQDKSLGAMVIRGHIRGRDGSPVLSFGLWVSLVQGYGTEKGPCEAVSHDRCADSKPNAGTHGGVLSTT